MTVIGKCICGKPEIGKTASDIAIMVPYSIGIIPVRSAAVDILPNFILLFTYVALIGENDDLHLR